MPRNEDDIPLQGDLAEMIHPWTLLIVLMMFDQKLMMIGEEIETPCCEKTQMIHFEDKSGSFAQRGGLSMVEL